VNIIICKRWLIAGVASLAVTLGVQAQTPAPIYTKNTTLRLPVQLDDRTKAEVAEIKLYVRGPSGTWECVQTSPSSQTMFDYKAPADGEYQFTFVTVDRRGTMTPRSVETSSPHRVVVVDSTPPAVTAQLKQSKTGEMLLECQVRDANPDWSTLRALYLAPGNSWQPLVPAGVDMPGTFKVPSTVVIENKVRVDVADKAGNRTTQDIDLNNPPPLPKSPIKPLTERGRPDPAMMTKDVDPLVTPPPIIPDRGVGLPEMPKPSKADVPPVPTIGDMPPLKMPDLPPDIKMPVAPDVKAPTEIPLEPPLPRKPTPDVRIPNVPVDPPPTRAPEVRPPLDNMKMPEIPDIKPPADLPPPPPIMPASRNTTSALKPSEIEKPAAGSHTVINTRTCSINYQLDGGARLTNRTDFWASADAGRTWTKLQDASHGVPPAKLTMPGDGVYGIRIRPGGGNKPPEQGEEPDCVIEIDTTNPAVNLLPPTFTAEDRTMILTWTAADTNLLSNSISLYYSQGKDGPWEVIVSGYKNEGVYRWTVPTTLTGPVYLRLEAMDRAGNVGRMELPSPVAIDVGKQRVKVIGVGPGQ
jgi:hypothetical protein